MIDGPHGGPCDYDEHTSWSLGSGRAVCPEDVEGEPEREWRPRPRNLGKVSDKEERNSASGSGGPPPLRRYGRWERCGCHAGSGFAGQAWARERRAMWWISREPPEKRPRSDCRPSFACLPPKRCKHGTPVDDSVPNLARFEQRGGPRGEQSGVATSGTGGDNIGNSWGIVRLYGVTSSGVMRGGLPCTGRGDNGWRRHLPMTRRTCS